MTGREEEDGHGGQGPEALRKWLLAEERIQGRWGWRGSWAQAGPHHAGMSGFPLRELLSLRDAERGMVCTCFCLGKRPAAAVGIQPPTAATWRAE